MTKEEVPDCNTCKPFERRACSYPDKWFRCSGCDRDVPWCYGCADDMFELCDACQHHVTKWREEARAHGS